MRNAYALLGISFIIVFSGAFVLLSDKAHAPTPKDNPVENIDIMTLSLTSSVFEHDDLIPSKYTCDGENISPPLSINGVPEGTKSLVLLMDDPDIPQEVKDARGIEKFDHWAVYNLSANIGGILEGEKIETTGSNSRGESSYAGPCPPTEYEPTEHRYFFKLFALSKTLTEDEGGTFVEIDDAMQGHVIEETVLIGRYSRVQ